MEQVIRTPEQAEEAFREAVIASWRAADGTDCLLEEVEVEAGPFLYTASFRREGPAPLPR